MAKFFDASRARLVILLVRRSGKVPFTWRALRAVAYTNLRAYSEESGVQDLQRLGVSARLGWCFLLSALAKVRNTSLVRPAFCGAAWVQV